MPIGTRYWDLIQTIAAEFALDPVLVEAVVVQESSGNTDAFRFEPNFYNRYIKPKGLFPGQNPRRVSSSYGLMQVMYPVALEDGYPKDLPPEDLFKPEQGIRAGCRRLRKLTDWADKGWPQVPAERRLLAVLASYNGGSGGNKPTDDPPRNGVYAKSVLNKYTLLAKERAKV